MKLEIPLVHGVLYNCLIEGDQDLVEESLIPLARDANTNRLFILTQAERLKSEFPELVKILTEMSFNDIWNDGLQDDFPRDFNVFTIVCTPQPDGSLLEFSGARLFSFQKQIPPNSNN
jgi:hypothetical protein